MRSSGFLLWNHVILVEYTFGDRRARPLSALGFQPELIGLAQQLNGGIRSEFLLDRGLMIGNRLRIESQGFGDLLDGVAVCQKAQHFEFARGQAVGLVE